MVPLIDLNNPHLYGGQTLGTHRLCQLRPLHLPIDQYLIHVTTNQSFKHFELHFTHLEMTEFHYKQLRMIKKVKKNH